MSFVLLRYLLLKNVALAACNIDTSMFIFMLLNENKFQFFFFFNTVLRNALHFLFVQSGLIR